MSKHVLKNLISSPWEERLPVLFKGSLSYCEMPWSLLLGLSLTGQVRSSCTGVESLPPCWGAIAEQPQELGGQCKEQASKDHTEAQRKGLNSCLAAVLAFCTGSNCVDPIIFLISLCRDSATSAVAGDCFPGDSSESEQGWQDREVTEAWREPPVSVYAKHRSLCHLQSQT